MCHTAAPNKTHMCSGWAQATPDANTSNPTSPLQPMNYCQALFCDFGHGYAIHPRLLQTTSPPQPMNCCQALFWDFGHGRGCFQLPRRTPPPSNYLAARPLLLDTSPSQPEPCSKVVLPTLPRTRAPHRTHAPPSDYLAARPPLLDTSPSQPEPCSKVVLPISPLPPAALNHAGPPEAIAAPPPPRGTRAIARKRFPTTQI